MPKLALAVALALALVVAAPVTPARADPLCVDELIPLVPLPLCVDLPIIDVPPIDIPPIDIPPIDVPPVEVPDPTVPDPLSPAVPNSPASPETGTPTPSPTEEAESLFEERLVFPLAVFVALLTLLFGGSQLYKYLQRRRAAKSLDTAD